MEEISPYNLDDLEVVPKKYRCFTFVAYKESESYCFDNILANLSSQSPISFFKNCCNLPF